MKAFILILLCFISLSLVSASVQVGNTNSSYYGVSINPSSTGTIINNITNSTTNNFITYGSNLSGNGSANQIAVWFNSTWLNGITNDFFNIAGTGLQSSGNTVSANVTYFDERYLQPSNTIYYLQNFSSDLANRKAMTLTPNSTRYSQTYPNINGNINIQNYSTPLGGIGTTFIHAGPFELHIHASATTSGKKPVQLYGVFTELNATGSVIKVIGTTEPTDILTSSETEDIVLFIASNVTTLNSTSSRIGLRLYANTSGVLSNPDVTIYVGDGSDSHIQLPIASGGTTNTNCPSGQVMQNISSGVAQCVPIVNDSNMVFSDITTNNAGTSKHGFLKKLDNDANHFMNGQGNWATPTGFTTDQNSQLSTSGTPNFQGVNFGTYVPATGGTTTEYLGGSTSFTLSNTPIIPGSISGLDSRYNNGISDHNQDGYIHDVYDNTIGQIDYVTGVYTDLSGDGINEITYTYGTPAYYPMIVDSNGRIRTNGALLMGTSAKPSYYNEGTTASLTFNTIGKEAWISFVDASGRTANFGYDDGKFKLGNGDWVQFQMSLQGDTRYFKIGANYGDSNYLYMSEDTTLFQFAKTKFSGMIYDGSEINSIQLNDGSNNMNIGTSGNLYHNSNLVCDNSNNCGYMTSFNGDVGGNQLYNFNYNTGSNSGASACIGSSGEVCACGSCS